MLEEHVLVCTESRDSFTCLVAALHDEFQPATTFEESLVDTMAVARWRQRRIWNIERESMNSGVYRAHDRNRAAMLSPSVLTSMAFGSLASETRTLDLLNEPEPTPPPMPAPGPELVPNAPEDPASPPIMPIDSTPDSIAPGVSVDNYLFAKRTEAETVKSHSQWTDAFTGHDFDPPPLVFHAVCTTTQL